MRAKHTVGTELSRRVEEFERFRDGGEIYSAIARLAEIFHSLQSLSTGEASRWRQTVKHALASAGRVDAVPRRVRSNAKRVRRLLAVGTSFGDEEVVLLLTLRIEGDLVEEFLRQWQGSGSGVRWDDIDTNVVALAKSVRHRRLFRRSQEQVRRNWGIPLHSKWLDPI